MNKFSLQNLPKKSSSVSCEVKYLALQGLLALLLATVMGVIFGRQMALAVLVGGLISCVSNVIFAVWFFSTPAFARDASKILTAFYTAECLKIFFTVAVFTISIMYLPLLLLPLFAAYFVIHLSFSFIGLGASFRQ